MAAANKSQKKSMNTVVEGTVVQAKGFDDTFAECGEIFLQKKKITELGVHDQYKLYGEDIPKLDENLAQQVKQARLTKTFKPGDLVTNDMYNYEIEVVLSNDLYKVKDLKHSGSFFLQMESVKMPFGGPKLKRDVRVLMKVRELAAPFCCHFLKLIDRGQVKNEYNFIVTQLCSDNLVDLRRKIGFDFLSSTAVRLSMQSLQAIHDLHICGFIHRNIQPRNFVVGLQLNAKILYIVNFSLSCPYTPPTTKTIKARLKKLPIHNLDFQSRAYHRSSNIRCLHDIESWCYMVHYLFNARCLPWDTITTSERRIYNKKWLFFTGHYDELFVQMGLPKHLKSLRERINLESSLHPVDYPVFAEVLISIGDDMKVDWSAPYEWELASNKLLSKSQQLENNKDVNVEPFSDSVDMLKEIKAITSAALPKKSKNKKHKIGKQASTPAPSYAKSTFESTSKTKSISTSPTLSSSSVTSSLTSSTSGFSNSSKEKK